MNDETTTRERIDRKDGSATLPIDWRSLLTWTATGFVVYEIASGALIAWLPFDVLAQYSILWHTGIGLLTMLPIAWQFLRHRRRRRENLAGRDARLATLLLFLVFACLASGLVITLEAAFTRGVGDVGRFAHQLGSIALAPVLLWHLYASAAARRKAAEPGRRGLYASIAVAIAIVPLAATVTMSETYRGVPQFQAFAEDYDWAYGDQRPFWPSRIGLAGAPWQHSLLAALDESVGVDAAEATQAVLRSAADNDLVDELRAAMASLELTDQEWDRVQQHATDAAASLKDGGALRAEALTGAEGCGASGCHEAIYKEWRSSAHGYSADDPLFLRVQSLLADTRGVSETRSCAGCHDPVALLSGRRTTGQDIEIFEGNSCLVCHRTVNNDTDGNGGYVIEPPERYLFETASSGIASLAGKFLIRSAPDAHVDEYSRALYKSSDFCAACHKQVPADGDRTSAGLAQEQNEYDSWKESPWYHGDGHPDTIECRECHMRLVVSDDPASGDRHDDYRSPDDGKHRSHRMLASNMYVPATMDIPGGDQQAALTIQWLRGEIDVPEISHKWTTGPVVELEILAPDEVRAGELVNLQLHLRNNKTGHDFPAGPLDVLESWIELVVEDGEGNVLMELGTEQSVSPDIDAPVVYKADWYDAQGLPVERHNLWEVVGASYRRIIQSGGEDIVDVPFRCPGIARPRLSNSVGATDAGERRSDVVFSLEDAPAEQLTITAKLLFRKANPRFLASVYDFEPVTEAPVIELTMRTKTVRVVQ